MMTVGQRIRGMREQKGLTQKYVAQKAGINVALLQLYEYGKRNPKDDQLKKIAAAMDVDPAVLRPPKIETETELLYALREISERFGVVLVEDEGQSVHIKLNQLRLVSEIEQDRPADDIKEARFTHIPAGAPDTAAEKEAVYTDQELVLRYSRALQQMRFIVKDKLDLVKGCLEYKDFRMAMMHAEALKRTVDELVKNELNTD